MPQASFQLLHHTAPHRTTPHHTTPHHTAPHHTTPNCNTPHHTTQHLNTSTYLTRHFLALDNGLPGSILAVLEHSRAVAHGSNGLAGVPKALDQLDGRGVLREVPEGPCGE